MSGGSNDPPVSERKREKAHVSGQEPGEPSKATIRWWRRMLADEREEARIYRELAARRTGQERAILLELADAEKRHAEHWEQLLGERVGKPRRGSLRMRLLAALARRFGWVFVLALMQQAEGRLKHESGDDVPAVIAADERIHGEVVRGLAARGRSKMSGTLRAAVFGINDGLVSNIALVLGVIGGGIGNQGVLLTGLSGLLAGALSMAAGEYISVTSQQELLAASKPDDTARAWAPDLDFDANELALVYRARGMESEEARNRADEVLRSRTTGTDSHETHSTGAEVVGSGIRAAGSSFVSFSAGAAIPVLPFLLGMSSVAAVAIAAILTGIALMITGATVGVLSGANAWNRALRQLLIGAAAAGVTYALGVLFGAVVG